MKPNHEIHNQHEKDLPMKQNEAAQPTPFENMTESQIIAHFEKYGFRDELGHELILCRDFLDLVALAAKKP